MLTVAEFREALRRPGGPTVRCPHCAGSLQKPHLAVVIASRHCPHCGLRVLAEPADPGTPTLTVEDVSALRAREDRFRQQMLWPAAVALLGAQLVGLVLAVFRDTLLAALAAVADEQTATDGLVGLMLAPLLIGGGWMVVLARRAEKQGGKCPHCPANLWHQSRLLAATGNCGRCGGRVADRPQAAPTDPPPRSIAEVLAAAQREARTAWRRLIVGFAGTAVMVAGFGIGSARLDGLRPFWADVERRYGLMTTACLQAAAAAIGSGLAIGPMFGGILWGLRTPPEVRCPHCGTAVGGGGLVVASKCCPGCGRRVLADPGPDDGMAEASPAG